MIRQRFAVVPHHTFVHEGIGSVTVSLPDVSFSLAESTGITEEARLQFRAEALNIFTSSWGAQHDFRYGIVRAITRTRLDIAN